ncbi:MAG: hypothetical protein WAS21_28225 [Geminicoccaceae bacterium]
MREVAAVFRTRQALNGRPTRCCLWVRVRSPERKTKAQEILREHGGEATRVHHEIEIDEPFEDMPLSSLVVDPWLGSEPLGAP